MKQGSTPIKSEAALNGSGSTLFARVVLYLVGTAALAVLFILLPELAREEAVGKPTDLTVPFLAVASVLATPFFVALYQTHQLLHLIDKNQAFSNRSINALRNIKICAIAFSLLIIITVIAGISISRMADPGEDVTFMVTFGIIFTFVSSVIAVFVAVLQKLLTDAVALKSENDLIV
jgi:hypothetical protein